MRNKSMGGPMGGSGGDHAGRGSVEDRLARRFASELSRAEGDYPKMRWLAGREGGRSFRRSWPRLQAVLIAGATLTIVALVAVSLTWRAGGGAAAGGSAGQSTSHPAGTVSVGSASPLAGVVTNGLPTHLNGDPVLQLWQRDRRAVDGTSFSLAGYKYTLPNPCSGTPAPTSADGPLDGQFIPTCDVVVLSPTPGDNIAGREELAPIGAWMLADVPDGTAVVVRLHSRDPRADACTEAARTACDEALVVDSIVWQGTGGGSIPAVVAYGDAVSGTVSVGADGSVVDINGTHVYTAGESFPTVGPFLVSGKVAVDGGTCDSIPSQIWSVVWPGCGRSWSVAGHQMVQAASNLDPLVGHTVVIRVYDAGSTTVCSSGEPRCRVLAVVEVLLVE